MTLPEKSEQYERYRPQLLLRGIYNLQDGRTVISQSINYGMPKYQIDTLDCTLEELAVLELVAKNPMVKQQELVEATGKSIATIK